MEEQAESGGEQGEQGEHGERSSRERGGRLTEEMHKKIKSDARRNRHECAMDT